MSQKLRVGVIGCGGIAQMMHLPTIAERPDLFELTAIADMNRATLDAVAKRYHAGATYSDYHELIARTDVDAVLLLASGSHREAALAVLGAKKHLFVEKPLGYCREEIEAIGRAADETKTTLFVGYHKRYDPAYARTKEAVLALEGLRFVEVTSLNPDDGAYRAHHAILPLKPTYSSVLDSEAEARGDRAAMVRATRGDVAPSIAAIAGGENIPPEVSVAAMVLTESLIHDVNALRGILGEPEAVLSAHAWRNGLAQTSVTRFSGDVTAVMNWVSAPGLKNYEERLRFVGANGRVTLTFPSPYLRHAPTPLSIEKMDGEELVVEQRVVSYEEAFRAELLAFHRAVRESVTPITSWKDALNDARFIEAIVRKMY